MLVMHWSAMSLWDYANYYQWFRWKGGPWAYDKSIQGKINKSQKSLELLMHKTCYYYSPFLGFHTALILSSKHSRYN